MTTDRQHPFPSLLVVLGAMACALLFAAWTNHTWEDYYITFRSSKNLATGHGLVFNHGERLHTFTSPLGVLLPAAASLLTGNASDPGALWIFRVMCAAAFGGAALLLLQTARRQLAAGSVGLLLAAWLITDPKSVDFTINGMETAFMLLFLAYAIWSHLTPGPRQWRHLGAAWAGLMWTRPDSFIYVGLVAGGIWLFNDAAKSGTDRRGLLALYLRAGLLTTVLYLPWIVWAWSYYGTPVPHTITAKGDIGADPNLIGLLGTAVRLPYLAWFESSSLELTFLPSYYMIGGWPAWLIVASRLLATACCLIWLLPFVGAWSRAASFAFYGAHVYLTYFPYFPFPWYIPSTSLLALAALAGLVDWLLVRGRNGQRLRLTVSAAALTLLLVNIWTTLQVGRQVAAQQELVEDGNRRLIGEWLRDQAMPGDTVFMEPLGYIGYFSGLKTFDWPGMSSPEMVQARRQVGSNWGPLLQYLEPTWIVLRPFEIDRVERSAPRLLAERYRVAKVFDQSAAIGRLSVHGRHYLEHDAHFTVYRMRRVPLEARSPVTLDRDGEVIRPLRLQVTGKAYHTEFNGHSIAVTGAPALIEFPLTPDLSELTGGFGLLDEEWYGVRQGIPVEFSITLLRTDGLEQELMRRELDPEREADHRGFRPFRISLPQPLAGRLRLAVRAAASDASVVRAFWGELKVVPLRTSLRAEERRIPVADSQAQFGLFNTEEDGEPCLLAHAPTELTYAWREGMNLLEAEFGIMRKAYDGESPTDGVVFVVAVENQAGEQEVLFRRHLDPARMAPDRGPQSLAVPIPANPGGKVILRTLPPPSGRLNSAWSYWRNLRVRP